MNDRVQNEYGYLAIQRVNGGFVKLPDGSILGSFENEAEAQRAWEEWITENLLAEAIDEARRKRREFADGCQVSTKREPQPGWTTPDRVYEEVYIPGDRTIEVRKGNTAASIIEGQANARFPEPTVGRVSVGLGDKCGVTKTVVWAAGLYVDGEHRRLPAFQYWEYGLPIQELLSVLNDLAAEGWSVAHVSEDRGVYQGLTNRTDSSVTKARYMLVRDRQSGVP